MSLQIQKVSAISSAGNKGKFSAYSNSRSFSSRSSISTSGFSSASLGGQFRGTQWSASKQSPQPYGVHSGTHISTVSVNKSLLEPLDLQIDRSFCAVRNQEKEQIKSLNNRFASFIDKVQFLEQQNKMLETKWNLLIGETAHSSQIKDMYETYITGLQHQLNVLSNDESRLDSELMNMTAQVEDCKQKYEEEITKRNSIENKFVILKKDVDSVLLAKADLEEKFENLSEETDFLRTIYDEEITELQASIKDTSVIVEMDNTRNFNMDDIIADIKAQYEYVAARSREEAELLYKAKVKDMKKNASYYDKELSITKTELAELKRNIKRLQSEIDTVKGKQATLESEIQKAESKGMMELKKARQLIRSLEEALNKEKQTMARQLKDYRELMNAKLALDIEIATYRKLLEGEEDRIGHQYIVNMHPGNHVNKAETRQQKLLIKRVETQDNRRVVYT